MQILNSTHEIFSNSHTQPFSADDKHICSVAHTTTSLCRKRRPIHGIECGHIKHIQPFKSSSCRNLHRTYHRRTAICNHRMFIYRRQQSSRQSLNDYRRTRNDGFRNRRHGMVILKKALRNCGVLFNITRLLEIICGRGDDCPQRGEYP